MAYRSDKETPDAPVAAYAADVTFATDDRAQMTTSPVSFHVGFWPAPSDPWHDRVSLEVRHVDPASLVTDRPPDILLLRVDQVAGLIEALSMVYGAMVQRDRLVN
jgi:hypothetical protein